jgi:hypothetical protein
MKHKERQAKKIAQDMHFERCYLRGWDDALELAAKLLKDFNKPELAILIKAVGSAEVDENGNAVTYD